MSNAELDHNNKVYPSIDGLVHQIVDALTESSDSSWYTFRDPEFTSDGYLSLNAVSYDEDGNEEKTYHVKIVVEAV